MQLRVTLRLLHRMEYGLPENQMRLTGRAVQGLYTHTPVDDSPSLLPMACPPRSSTAFTPEFTIHTVRLKNHFHLIATPEASVIYPTSTCINLLDGEEGETLCTQAVLLVTEKVVWVQPEDRRESLKAAPHSGAAEAGACAESRPVGVSASNSRC